MPVNNSYSKPRQMIKPRNQRSKKEVPKLATLSLPYTNASGIILSPTRCPYGRSSHLGKL